MLKGLEDKKALAWLVLLCILLTAAPFALRAVFFSGLLPGSESYYHARLAEEILESGIPSQDVLAKPYSFNPYHLLLAGLIKLFGLGLVSLVLPVALGVISLLLFRAGLKKWIGEKWKLSAILFLLIISPVFISTFATLNPHSLALPLILAALLLLSQTLLWKKILGIALLSGVTAFGSFQAILALAIFLAYLVTVSKQRLLFWFLFVILTSAALLMVSFSLPPQVLSLQPDFSILLPLGDSGFSVFGLLLAGLGFLVSWKAKKPMLPLYLMALFLGAAYLIFRTQATPYLNLIRALFSGLGLAFIYETGWRVEKLKQLTITLLIIGLVFSAYSFESRLITSPPTREMAEGLKFLQEEAFTTDKVLSHHSNGYFIEYFARLPVVLDSNFIQTPDFAARLNISETIFSSRNLKTTSGLFRQNNIKYVYITDEMRNGQVWRRENEGLLFLFRNNETFKKIFENQDVEVWQYVQEG